MAPLLGTTAVFVFVSVADVAVLFNPLSGTATRGRLRARLSNFCGRRVEMRISISTPSGRPVDAILTVICPISDDGQLPAQAEEGIHLVIPGVINFNKSEGA